MYHNLGNRWGSSLLGFIGVPLATIPFVLYWYGPAIRARSSFAEEIALAEHEAKMRDEQGKLQAAAQHAREKESEGREMTQSTMIA